MTCAFDIQNVEFELAKRVSPHSFSLQSSLTLVLLLLLLLLLHPRFFQGLITTYNTLKTIVSRRPKAEWNEMEWNQDQDQDVL